MPKKIYPRTFIEELWSRFDQIRPVVFHFEVQIHEKPLTPKNIGKALKGPHRQFSKHIYFSSMGRTIISTLFWLPYQPNTSPTEKSPSVISLLWVSGKATITMLGNIYPNTVQI